ncbi:hypothetical protein [Brachybacterium hainanense]|uniref:Uncharacterized protein n=1 Tax=Brachybacterium hainanense TaxID=1541174 RepID=A0ABV6RC38_9MICO
MDDSPAPSTGARPPVQQAFPASSSCSPAVRALPVNGEDDL